VKFTSAVFMLAGIVIGVAIGPFITRVGAQQSRKPYARLTTPRIAAVQAADMTPEQKAIGGNANIASLLHNPGLAKQWWAWLTFIYDQKGTRGDAALPLNDKELLLMRTAWLTNDHWLQGMHVPMAKDYGFSEEMLARIPKGASASGWDDKQRALLTAADELHYDSFITDDTWKKLKAYYNDKQMLDILFFVGTYHTNAYYTNSTGMPFATGRTTTLPSN
jgi:4-carboxymuconolactone decarboxylase